MKKLKYFLLLLLFLPLMVFASDGDRIEKIDVEITLDQGGNAHIVEVWQATAGSGSEFYKAEYNLGNMEISNFQVIDESGTLYTFVDDWNIDASIEEKAYKNGFYYSTNGLELCWGKSTIGKHIYTISYDVSNFVFNTSDSQVLYWQVINEMEMMPDSFLATIKGPTTFSDSLDVWGYGYKGYAYVSDGKIMMSNEENTDLSSGDYAVLLVKFPLNTFAAENEYDEYSTFDDVFNKAEEGSFDYNYNSEEDRFKTVFTILRYVFFIVIFVFGVVFTNNKIQKYKFGSAGRNINMNDINMYRDIPCKKNVFNAFFVSKVYNLNGNETDFFGTVFLKWLFENKVEVKKAIKKNLLGKSKEEISLVLKDNLEFDNDAEKTLYSYLKLASKDNVLEKDELSRWSKNNYNKLFSWFDSAEKIGRATYLNLNLVIEEKKGLSTKYLIKDELKKEAIELAGLKKFLLEFSRIKDKEAIEVVLWKEYLMYAQIFGIADKVAKQFERLYPELLKEMPSNITYSDIILINYLSNAAVVSATSARSAAQSYSAGGGGFSSGGGGGGSFGGGGGGGR